MKNRNKHDTGRRNVGVSGICLAAMLAITAAPASAQDISEFEDPLAQMRAKIEQVESGKAATLADATGETVAAASVGVSGRASATPDVNDPLSRISERLGLPVLGLVALAGLALLALLLGLMWLITRLRGRHASKLVDRELYAIDDGARGRRELQSGVMAKKSKAAAPESKSTELGKLAVPSAAAAAAAIISDDVDHDQDAYDQPEAEEAPKSIFGKARKEEEVPVDTEATDPASWRRPNLDRLKASIREDWQGDKDEKAERAAAMATAGTTAAATSATETPDYGSPESESQGAQTENDAASPPEEAISPFRREAENFASLFGDDDPAPAANDDHEAYFSEGLGTPASDDRTMFSDLRSTIEKTADVTSPEALEKRRAELPSRDDAMRRIRALRESVKAS